MKVSFRARVGALSLDVDFELAPRTTVILGPNGAGKTSLLLALLGKIKPDEGFIQLGDRLLFEKQKRIDLPIEQRHIGYVPQNYALFPHMTVRENVAFAVKSAGAPLKDIDEAISQLGLQTLAHRNVSTLSGGEKQRVALARALSIKPQALLLDEPLSALDIQARRDVRAFLAQTFQSLRIPILLVTHDAEDARVLSQSLLAMESGKINQQGTWEDFLSRPASPFIAEIMNYSEKLRTTTPPR